MCEGGGWRSRLPVPTGCRTPVNPRARRCLPFGTPHMERYSPETPPMFAPRPKRDPRRALFTPSRDSLTCEERAAMSRTGQHWRPTVAPPTPRKPQKFRACKGVNYDVTRRNLFRSPGMQNLSDSSFMTACDSPLSMYSTPPPSTAPFCPPPPPMPSPSRMPPPFSPENHKPFKMRSTALPGVVVPIKSPFTCRNPDEFVSMQDLINIDYLRLGPFPPGRPLASSSPRPRSPLGQYYNMAGMKGHHFPTPRMFSQMSPGEWGPKDDEFWPDKWRNAPLYRPETAVCPNAPPKIKISPWPRHHPAPQC